MRKQLDKVKQLHKGRALDLHRVMLEIEHDAVLIVIHIWRVLESPLRLIDRQRNDAVVLARRVVDASRIAIFSLQSRHFG